MSRVARFYNRHRGERGVIVANGPSLNMMDLAFLRDEIVIGLNKIYLGVKRFGFYPKYLVAVNEKVIQQAALDIARMTCVKFIGERGAQYVPEDALTYHLATKNVPCRFCKDLEEGVHEGWTVTYAALQIAYYLGFRETVIVGMDHRFEYSGEPNQTSHFSGPDVNHFSDVYFSGQDWDNPDLIKSEESYRIARDVFEADNRRIIDATVGGACPVFEKGDYRDIFFG